MVGTNIMVGSKKAKFYRGKEIDELKQMEVREFAKLLPARERRSVLRGGQKLSKFLEKSRKDVAKGKIPKTQSRELVILPEFVGWTVGVYNGKEYVQVKISEEMLGHRLGEFSQTRRTVKHGAAGVGATRGSASLSVK